MADAELKIVITAINQAKDVINQVSKQIGDLQKVVSTGFGADASDELPKQLEKIREHAKEGHGAFGELNEKIKETFENFNKLAEVVEFVAGGFLAIAGVHLAKELADEAAVSQQLEISLRAVGTQAGYTVERLEEIDKGVQAIGISAETSRRALTRMIENGLPPDIGEKLAVVSRDLAAISGANTSETFARVAQAVDTGNTLILRRMGIVIDRQRVLNDATREAGHYLNTYQQRLALANAVLAETAKIQGVYNAANGTAGQLLGDMSEKTKALKDALGEVLLPTYTSLLQVVSDVITALTETVKKFEEGGEEVGYFSKEAGVAGHHTTVLGGAIKGLGAILVQLIQWAGDASHAIKELWNGVVLFVGITAVIAAVGALTAAIAALPAVVAAAGVAITGLGVLLAANPIILAAAAMLGLFTQAVINYHAASGAADHHKASTKSDEQAVEDYIATIHRQVDAVKARNDAEEAYRKAKTKNDFRPSNESREELAAAERSKAATELRVNMLEALRKEQAKDLDNRKLSDHLKKEATEATEYGASTTKATNEASQAWIDFQQNYTQAGGDIDRFTQNLSKNFRQNLAAITDSIKRFKEQGDVNVAIDESLRSLSKYAKGVVTSDDMADFLEVANQFRAEAKELRRDVDAEMDAMVVLAASAQKRARAEAEHGGTEGLAEFNRHMDAINKQMVQSVNTSVTASKEANTRALEVEKEAFDTGLSTVDQYYAARLRIAVENVRSEQRLAEAQLRQQKEARDRAEHDGATPAALEALDVGIQTAQDHITQILDKSKTEQLKIQTEYERAGFQQTQQIAGLRSKVMADQGATLASKLLEIETKYKADLRSIAKGDDEGMALLARQRALDESKAKADSYAESVQKVADLQTTLNDREEAYIGLLKDKGLLTDLDALDRQNELIQRRIDVTQQLIDTQYQLARAAHESGRELDEAQHVAKAMSLENEILKLNASIKTTGDTIRQTFQDGLGNALTDAITGAKTWHDAFIGFMKDINKQLISIVTKDFSQNITKLFDGKDENGQGGFFDAIGAAITGHPNKSAELKQKGLRPNDALYVHVVNMLKDRPTDKTVLSKSDAVAAPVATESAVGTEVIQPKMAFSGAFDYTAANRTLGRKGTLDTPSFDAEFDKAADNFPILNQYGGGNLLRFLAVQESSLRANAVSPKGAEGVMQLMPDTSKMLGVKDAFDPKQNINGGAALLARLLRKYKDAGLALAAYNWGEGNVDEYLKTGVGVHGQAMPKETRDYVAALSPAAGGSNQFVTAGATTPPTNGAVPTGIKRAGTENEPIFVKVVGKKDKDEDEEEGKKEPGAKPSGGSSESDTAYSDQVARWKPGTPTPKYGFTMPEEKNGTGDLLVRLKNMDMAGGLLAGGTLGGAIGSAFGGPKSTQLGMRIGGGLGLLSTAIPKLFDEKDLKDFGKSVSGFFGSMKGQVSEGFKGLGDDADKGGMGIGGMFSALGGSLKSAFDGIKGLFSDEGGSGGGGGGGALASLAMLFKADGGYISGPGTGTSDSIPAMLSNGEYVMPAAQTEKFLPMLHAMRAGALDRLSTMAPPTSRMGRFALGGMVGSSGGGVTIAERKEAPAPQVQLAIHPSALNMTLSTWLEGELGRIAATGG